MVEETEAKFFVDNYKNMIKKILAIATFKKAAYELTIMYDNNNKTLFRDDARLRLRKIIDIKNKNKEECELSYKKPKTREGIKIEEEVEVKTSSFLDTEEILTKLGYFKISSYERIRDTFYANNCKITVDSFPFGDLLEIEGKLENIINISKKLGLEIKNNTTKSCDDIYVDICTAKGETIKEHIIFNENTLSEKEKSRRSYYDNHLET